MKRTLALTLLLFATWAQAETHALLVGVNPLPKLPTRLHLHGATNDVALMRDALLARGVPGSHIQLLARGVPGSQGGPTLAAIRAAMAQVLARVRRGDRVVLHLAGHGVQVPQATGGREPDGLDEAFLAEDVARWDGTQLPGALRDKEVAAWTDALVDAGVQVFLALDTCHAAGLLRGSPRSGIRSMLGAELGIPTTPVPATRAPQAPRLDGRVIALAARSHEVTGEEWLPRGAGLRNARRHGVFSHALAELLREGVPTAAALRSALAARYAAEGRRSPTPQVLGEGTLP